MKVVVALLRKDLRQFAPGLIVASILLLTSFSPGGLKSYESPEWGYFVLVVLFIVGMVVLESWTLPSVGGDLPFLAARPVSGSQLAMNKALFVSICLVLPPTLLGLYLKSSGMALGSAWGIALEAAVRLFCAAFGFAGMVAWLAGCRGWWLWCALLLGWLGSGPVVASFFGRWSLFASSDPQQLGRWVLAAGLPLVGIVFLAAYSGLWRRSFLRPCGALIGALLGFIFLRVPAASINAPEVPGGEIATGQSVVAVLPLQSWREASFAGWSVRTLERDDWAQQLQILLAAPSGWFVERPSNIEDLSFVLRHPVRQELISLSIVEVESAHTGAIGIGKETFRQNFTLTLRPAGELPAAGLPNYRSIREADPGWFAGAKLVLLL